MREHPMSEDTMRAHVALQRSRRRQSIRHDLDALLQLVPPDALRERWIDMPDLTARDLRAVRRDFAKDNHPDKAPPESRTLATTRLALANAVIDATLEDL
jgi:hypothetical protein